MQKAKSSPDCISATVPQYMSSPASAHHEPHSPACSLIFILHNAQYEVEGLLTPFFSASLNAEFIIIDDGSEDGTDNAVNSLLDHFELEDPVYLRNETRRGIGMCLNEAVLHATAPTLFIVDTPVEVDTEAMRRALALLEHSDAAFCTPSGSSFGNIEALSHFIYEQRVPASAAFLIYKDRISAEQLFFNPFISRGHAAELCLRTAGQAHHFDTASFITEVKGQPVDDLARHLMLELSLEESSVMSFHAGRSAAAEKPLSEQNPQLLYKRARLLKLDGRIAEALQLCDEILHEHPDHHETMQLKTDLLGQLKQFVEHSALKHGQLPEPQKQDEQQATVPEEAPAKEAGHAETPIAAGISAGAAGEEHQEDEISRSTTPDEPAGEAKAKMDNAASEAVPSPEIIPDSTGSGTAQEEEEEELIDPRFQPDSDFYDDDDEEVEAISVENTSPSTPAKITEDAPSKVPDEAAEEKSLPAADATDDVAPEERPTSVSEEEVDSESEKAGEEALSEATEEETPAEEPVGRKHEESPEPQETAAEAEPETSPDEAADTSQPTATPETPAAETVFGNQQPEQEEKEIPHFGSTTASGGSSNGHREKQNAEPENQEEKTAAQTGEHPGPRSPYKRPMNFYYTIVMPVAGMALEMLEACILKIEEQCDPDKTELIIIDNACLDETHEYLKQLSADKFFHLHVITNRRNKGFARSVNQGIEKALGEYICIMHNDVAPESDFLFELSEILNRNPKAGLVGPMTDKSVNPEQVGHPKNNALSAQEATYLDSFCMMMRAEDNYRLSEDYGPAWFDDADLSFQVQQNGQRSLIAGGVFLPHYSGGTTEQLGLGLDSELYQNNLATFNKKWHIEPPMPDIEEAEHPLAEIYELGQLLNVYHPHEEHVKRITELFTPDMDAELQKQKDLGDEATIFFIRAMMAIDNRPSLRMLEERLEGKLDEAYALELVRYYYKRHIYSRCKKHMDRVKGQPGLWFAMYELRIAYQDKQLERVAELLHVLLEAYPAHPEINKIAGDMYHLIGDREESEEFYALADQVDPYHYAWPEDEA